MSQSVLKPKPRLTSVSYANKKVENVTLLNLEKVLLERLPMDLHVYFPYLEGIYAWRNVIKVIKRRDISGFPQLRFLDLNGNKLTSLPGNLFQQNKNLQRIVLSGNDLTAVGPNLLQNLRMLQWAEFSNSGCVNFTAKESNEVAVLRSKIAESCTLAIEDDSIEQGIDLRISNTKENEINNQF